MPVPVEKDGNVDFSGGMDSSRKIYLLGKNQYFRGCNVIIPRNASGLRTRPGFRNIEIVGDINDKRIYENASNVQAEGWYNDGKENVLLRVVDGYILELRKLSEAVFRIKVLNRADRNNPRRSKAWITRVPGGAIVNDGQALPYIITRSFRRRSLPNSGEIGVGRMGVYVQNRFFYVDEDGSFIWASDFKNPVSIKNAKNTNVLGFVAPEDQDVITAIGSQKASLNYVEGGVLSFSTRNNTYSVDVRGDRQNWEVQDVGVGKVQEAIPGIGAVSSYSYESFNSNLWFRTADFGLMNLRRTQYQFVEDDDYSSQSIEADYWLSNDTELLLDRCYTRQYRNRLFCTIAPAINQSGYVYWNGILSMNPDPTYGQNKLPRRFEGIFTGVRPWCMTSIDGFGKTEFYIDSYDADGKTRLYRLDEDITYDVNHKRERIEIESWFETRGYFHGDVSIEKKPIRRSYFISELKRDVHVKLFSRSGDIGPFVQFADKIHKVDKCATSLTKEGKVAFMFTQLSDQSRSKVDLPEEKPSECASSAGLQGNNFFFRQDRIEIKGHCSFDFWLREAEAFDESKTPVCGPETEAKRLKYSEKKDFTYLISERSE